MSAVRVAYLDGRRLAHALAGGARAVAAGRAELDRINVFPVADNDTGSNLAATLARVSAAVSGSREREVARIARLAADEALMGSRGNSGAILAQLLEGFAAGVSGARRLSTREFGAAAGAGAAAAREAMAQPREGTILSVVTAFAEEAARRARETADFAVLFPLLAAEARRALLRTKDQLEALRRAGVVDAGAQGFVYMLEGAIAAFGRGAEPFAPPPEDRVEARIRESRESILFRYCTEALVTGARLERDALRRALAPLGDSIAVVGGTSRLRIHIHVNRPEDAFAAVRCFGDVVETKVEDMRDQHLGRFVTMGRVAVVTDSACDLPDADLESEGIRVVPLRLLLGDETFLDKVTITPAEFHRRLSEGRLVARTSQPPPADFREVYGALAAHGAPVLGIHVSGALSGTFSAARTAAGSLRADGGLAPIAVLDSRNVSVGQGLVVREAARAARNGATHAETLAAAAGAASRARLYAAVPSLDTLVRGGRVTAGQRALANALGVVPLLTLDPSGRARAGGASRGFPRACAKLVEKALARTRGLAAPTWGVAHFEASSLAARIVEELLARRPRSEAFLVEVAPALAAHTGPGAVAVGFLGSRTRGSP
ncbi:MAG: DegV family protein [Thermoanaerobaculia bacterium]